jgi:hypothetical protein
MTRRISPLPRFYAHSTRPPPPSQIVILRHPPIVRRPPDPLLNKSHSNMGAPPIPAEVIAAGFARGGIVDVVQ